MRLSYQWLAELVDGLPGVDEVAERLTMGGIEVEGVHRPSRFYGDRLVVARIERKEQHPNADRLTVCSVDDGSGQLLTIVCGARNHSAGDTVVLAREGCELPGGLTIRRSKLRGVESQGMLCSAAELGLEAEGEGILLLEADLRPGTEAAPLLGLGDTVLELGVTPNRGDCLSMRGLAREVAALCGLSLREAAAPCALPDGNCPVRVTIEDEEACPLYLGVVLRGVRVGPSPTWLRTRLGAMGLRSINNVVDVTNLVLLETGQPMHAFDLGRISGGEIRVRRTRPGESLRTLDGRDVELLAEDLVIADQAGPVALAGVMGGEGSAVHAQTRDVFLEAALFAPSTVRRTARRHGILTDSSHRFERGIDSAGTAAALGRAVSLLVELAAASLDGGAVRQGPGPRARAQSTVRAARVRALLGLDLADARIESVLEAIGASPRRSEGGWQVEAPSFRSDLGREIDYVEEVARIVGYDAFEPAMPTVTLTPVAVPESWRLAGQLRTLLAGLGLHEHIPVSFAAAEDNARFPGLCPEDGSVVVRNPLRADATQLQRSVLGPLVRALAANVAVQQPRADLFSLARVFAAAGDGETRQREVLGGVLYGPRPGGRPGQEIPLGFADLAAVVGKALAVLAPGTPVEIVPAAEQRPEYHPRAAGRVLVGGHAAGWAGRLHPDLVEGFEITGEIYAFEVDCRETVAYRREHPGLLPIPRHPSSERDVSLLVPASTPASAALKLVAEMDESEIESISVFDEYSGAGVEQGLKALGYRIVYRAGDRTLTDAEVGELHDKVVGLLTERLGARARS